MAKSKKTGCVLIGIGVVLLVIGMVMGGGGTFRFVAGITGMTDKLQQIKAPGSSQITVTETGTQVIYHEYRSTVDGRHDSSPQGLGDMTCRVETEDGQEVPVGGNQMNETYNLGGRSGVAVWQFEANAKGLYAITASRPVDAPKNEVILAVGPSVLSGIMPDMGWFFGGLFIGIFAGTVGLILLVVGIIIRLVGGQAQTQP